MDVPSALRELRAWVLWKPKPRREGKADKIPYCVDGRPRSGTQGSEQDRAKLAPFADAVTALQASKGKFAGLGLAMLPEFSIVGLDFDDCIDEQGRTDQWVLDLCQSTYAERSPSGKGVRAFYLGALPDFKNHAEGVEVFCAKGFVTVTGDALPNSQTTLAALPDEVREVLEGLRPSNAPGVYEEGGDKDAPYLATDIGEPTLGHVKQALDFLPSDDRDLWTRLAHALKPLGNLGRGLWETWSQKSQKYDAKDAARVWRSVRSSRIGYKTVLATAYRAGWQGPVSSAALPSNDWPACIDLVTLDQRPPHPPRFIIEDWIPCGYATLFAGHGGAGKSGIALHLAVCIADGRLFFGVHTEPRRVLYVSCEDRVDILHWRLKHICDYEGIRIADTAGKLAIVDLVGHDPILFDRDPRTGATRTRAYECLAERVGALKTEVLVVDGISDAFGGNENSKVEVKRFVNSLLALIPPETGAVLLIGHVAKTTAAAPNTAEGYSGTTGWHNAARARWYLYPETEPGDDWSAGRLARTGTLLLELQKSNYGASDQAMRFHWDERAHLFIGEATLSQANPAHRATQEAQEKQGILDAGRAAIGKGLTVPAAMNGSKTAFHVLSAEPAFPQSLKGSANRARFGRLLREMLSAEVIKEDAYMNQYRHAKQRLLFP